MCQGLDSFEHLKTAVNGAEERLGLGVHQVVCGQVCVCAHEYAHVGVVRVYTYEHVWTRVCMIV